MTFDMHGYRIVATLGENGLHVDFVVTEGDDELVFRGTVKWDGCSNWFFDESIHFCGLAGVNRFGEVLGKIYAAAGEMMPGRDLS